MRSIVKLIAVGAALVATPALAQLNLGGGGRIGVGTNVQVDTGRIVDSVRGTLDRTVDQTDRTLNRTLARDLVVATRADVRSGAVVRDTRGRRVGTVQSVHGDTAVVVQGGRQMHVPLASLYRSGADLVTNVSRARLRASAAANADANASVRR